MPPRCRIDLTQQEATALLDQIEHDGPGDPLHRVFAKLERATKKFNINPTTTEDDPCTAN